VSVTHGRAELLQNRHLVVFRALAEDIVDLNSSRVVWPSRCRSRTDSNVRVTTDELALKEGRLQAEPDAEFT
jgi:hypothetical protein